MFLLSKLFCILPGQCNLFFIPLCSTFLPVIFLCPVFDCLTIYFCKFCNRFKRLQNISQVFRIYDSLFILYRFKHELFLFNNLLNFIKMIKKFFIVVFDFCFSENFNPLTMVTMIPNADTTSEGTIFFTVKFNFFVRMIRAHNFRS